MTRPLLRVWTGALTCAALVLLSGCDVPTGSNDPSLNTGTSIGAPLIAQKTYSFLGGPESENEPIIDTTSTSSKSLRASIEKVSSSTSSGGPQNKLSLSSGFSEVLVEESDDLATQEVDVTVSLSGLSAPSTNKEVTATKENINVQGGSTENNNFGAVDVADGSTLDIDVKNNTTATLKDVELTLENNQNAASDFDAPIPSLNVTEQIGDISSGGTGSVSVTTWEDPTDRAIKEAIDVTVKATADGAFTGGEIKIFLGGEGGASTLTAQTLYFRPEGETVTSEGTADVLEPGRVDFGSNSYIELSNPTIDIKGLNIRSPNLDPKAQFQSFTLRYPDDITFANSGMPFEVDLVQDAPNFDGNARSCPCDPTVDLGKNIRFDGLQGNEDIEFELETTFEDIADNPNATAIISVGDEVRADDTGFPISETFRVNWGLTTSSKDEVTVRDTLDADFSGLEDLTESGNDVQLDEASLDFTYENTLPLGADLTLTVVDENGNPIRTLSPASSSSENSSDEIPLDPAEKDGDGNATTPFPNPTIALDLGERQRLQELADGRRIRLRMDMAQKQNGPPARIKAKDTLQFNLSIDTEGTVNTDR